MTTPERAPIAVALTLGPVPLRLSAPLARGWRSWAVGALLVSITLHAVLGGAALLSAVPELRGGGGHAEGDEMIIVLEATALDSSAPTTRTGATSAAARAQAEGEPSAVATPPARVVAQLPKPESVNPQPDAEGQPPAADATPAPAARPPATEGGNLALGLAVTAALPTAAAAQAGVLERYRNEVQQALVRQPPKGKLAAGTTEPTIVTIEFSLSEAGRVEAVQVVKASRSEKLDRLLTAWIIDARLPVPPAGLTAAERRFSFPFTIR